MDETIATGRVRVATLNLWGRPGAWEERRRVLAEGFRELAPDLVAFQEVVVRGGYDQVADILGPDYHLAHQTDRELGRGGDIENGQGISIASRWPLGEVWEPDLNVTSRTDDFACETLIAEVFAPDPIGTLLFVNHLPNWQLTFEYERELQTVIAARTIEEIATARGLRHVVLAGDLDATPRRGERALLAQATVFGRDERVLPRRLGQHPPGRTRPHLNRREPARDRRELGLGAGARA
jgi:endonuclease/exonuclease/phosphatase family metal-dependent hydrolase